MNKKDHNTLATSTVKRLVFKTQSTGHAQVSHQTEPIWISCKFALQTCVWTVGNHIITLPASTCRSRSGSTSFTGEFDLTTCVWTTSTCRVYTWPPNTWVEDQVNEFHSLTSQKTRWAGYKYPEKSHLGSFSAFWPVLYSPNFFQAELTKSGNYAIKLRQ